MNIGTLTLSKEGGWIGFIHTLTIHSKIRLVPNDDATGENSPAFRVILGNARIGDAWEAKTNGDAPKNFLRLRIDDPCFPEPISAALFPSDTGTLAQLVWNRRREG